MSQSDESDSGDENEAVDAGNGLNLAGFLFGNIGEDGRLEENFLDEASKRKLGGLSQVLGLDNLIQEEDLVSSLSRRVRFGVVLKFHFKRSYDSVHYHKEVQNYCLSGKKRR